MDAEVLQNRKFSFQVFDKRTTPLVKRPEVTIQSKGTMSLNASAHHVLGEPEAVELLYDPAENVIGFRAVPPETAHAYPIRSVGGRGSTFIIAGRAFLAYFKIAMGTAVRRDALMVDNVLVIDLNDPGRVAISNRTRNVVDENEESVNDADALSRTPVT